MKAITVVIFAMFAVVASWSPTASSLQPRKHAPIWIHGDDDFELPSVISGVRSGRGTPEDPYLISGWDILATTGQAIRVEDTSAYVVVRANLLHDGDHLPWVICADSLLPSGDGNCVLMPTSPATGIWLRNASNVLIEDNVIHGNTIGVAVEQAKNIHLRQNKIMRSESGRGAYALFGEADQALTWAESALAPRMHLASQPATGVSILASERVQVKANHIGGYDGFAPRYAHDYALQIEDSQVDLDANRIVDNDIALRAAGSTITAARNVIQNASVVTFFPGNAVTFSDNSVVNVDTMAFCGGSAADVLRNELTNATLWVGSPGCAGRATATVRGNRFESAYLTISSESLVEDNRFLGSGIPSASAVFVDRESPRLQGNSIRGYSIGIRLHGSAGIVDGNRIEANDVGVAVASTTKPVLRNNSMLANFVASVYNTDAAQYTPEAPPGAIPVDARWNWWGSASGPPEGTNGLIGSVLATPWLDSDPL